MTQERYDEIKAFMNGRDVTQSYSDPKHNSTIDFQEFVEVWENEQRLIAEANQPEQPIE